MDKKELRKSVKKLVAQMSAEEKLNESMCVFHDIENSDIFINSKNIMLFASLPDEIPTHHVIERWAQHKNIFLPRVNGDDLEIIKYRPGMLHKGSYDIMEPEGNDTVEPQVLDLIIVPGVAFDRHGNRLGRGKGFYDRLVKRGFIALTGMKGEDTMSRVAVSVRAKVRELGNDRVPMLFRKNPYMCTIYPKEESRRALTVFQIYEGTGEWFDLSRKPIERASFAFGGAEKKKDGYCITDACIGCGNCAAVCPQNCIRTDAIPHVIEQGHCLHCGNCMEACPVGAIERR